MESSCSTLFQSNKENSATLAEQMYRNYRSILLLPETIESFRRLTVLGDPINTGDMLCKLPTKWTCKSGNIDTGFAFLLHPRLQKSTECDCLLSYHGLDLSGQIDGTRDRNVIFCASAHSSPLQEITLWD